MERQGPIGGARRVDVVYSLAMFALDAASYQWPVGALLVGRVSTEMVFATAMFQLPLEQVGLARETAEQLLVDLSAALYVNVDRVLEAGVAGQPLSAPVQHMQIAIKNSPIHVTAIRPESSIQVELADALVTAHEIVQQHLVHEQMMAQMVLHDVLPLRFECGPFGYRES